MHLMRIDIVTIFPQMFRGPLDESILKRAQNKSLVNIHIHDLRQWATDKHKSVDNSPYGGGPGMVMMIEPLYKAVQDLKITSRTVLSVQGQSLTKPRVILMTPQGKTFNQKKAKELSELDRLIFICGHYEGVDERVREHLVDEEISIGDYVLTGGELPTMVVIDSVVRLIPGVLGKEASLEEESFSIQETRNKKPTRQAQGKQETMLLEYPHYTRPEEFKGWKVPDVLLSGNHAEINKWRKEQAFLRTKQRRPDLFSGQQ